MSYIKMTNFSDLLAIKIMADHDEISGNFIEEIENRSNVWWQLEKKKNWFIKKGKDLFEDSDWEIGQPSGTTREVGWSELLRKIAIQQEQTNKLSLNVIIKTSEQSIFSEIIRQHFLLQQGDISFSSPDEVNNFWLIKIAYPSYWCLSLLDNQKDFKIYNQIDNTPGLYLESGWQVKELTQISKMHTLSFLQNNIFLINSNGEIETYKVSWKNDNKIIEIKSNHPVILSANEDIKIEIKTRLVEDRRHKTPYLWEVEDIERLNNILSGIASERLAGFKAWFSKDSLLYILSSGEFSDTALSAVFSDAFEKYSKYSEKIFFQHGKILMPILEEAKIMEIYEANSSDYLIFSEGENEYSPVVTILKDNNLKNLDNFINYRAEKNIREIENFDSQWKFDFSNIKKKTLIIEVDIDETKTDNEEILKFKKKNKSGNKTKANNLNDNPEFELTNQEENKWDEVIADIQEIDSQLLDNITDINLWQTRATLSQSIGFNTSYIIAELIQKIIKFDNKELFEKIENHYKDNNELKNLFLANITEEEKGQLLAEIRNKNYSAELNYILQLYFAIKFTDEDIFRFAVDSMRSGYYKQSYSFYEFEDRKDVQIKKDNENSNSLINRNNLHKIYENIQNFLKIINVFEHKTIVISQFRKLLKYNKINGLDIDTIMPEPIIANEDIPDTAIFNNLNILKKYDELIETNSLDIYIKDKTKYLWLSQLSMKNIDTTPIKDLFTGDLNRSSFTSDFNAKELAFDTYEKYLKNEKDWDKLLLEDDTELQKAKSQRILLYMVNEFGPLNVFRQYLLEPVYKNSYYNIIVMNCDIYRIYLRYNIKIDEDFFFNELILALPEPPNLSGYCDFKDATEIIILCLFISGCKNRQRYLDSLLIKAMQWFESILDREDFVDEMLTLISYLELSVLLTDVSDTVSDYNFKARIKSLWVDHANKMSKNSLNLILVNNDFD